MDKNTKKEPKLDPRFESMAFQEIYYERKLELLSIGKQLRSKGLLKEGEEILQYEDLHPIKQTHFWFYFFLTLFFGLLITFYEDAFGTTRLITTVLKSFFGSLFAIVILNWITKKYVN